MNNQVRVYRRIVQKSSCVFYIQIFDLSGKINEVKELNQNLSSPQSLTALMKQWLLLTWLCCGLPDTLGPVSSSCTHSVIPVTKLNEMLALTSTCVSSSRWDDLTLRQDPQHPRLKPDELMIIIKSGSTAFILTKAGLPDRRNRVLTNAKRITPSWLWSF